MAMNDPLGDMLTRIRNAQMRKRGKVSTPGSSLRQKVLDVLERPRLEVVHANHPEALRHQVIAQVRPEEACAPRHDRRCHRVDASGVIGGRPGLNEGFTAR